MRNYIACLAVLLMIVSALPIFGADQAPAPASTEAPALNNTTAPAAGAIQPGVVPEDYEIQPEDVLRLDIWGEPTLSNVQFQVTPDGNINVPYVGAILATGKTQQTLESEIAQKYVDGEILASPKVNITLLNMHKPMVRVTGQVNRPGSYEFKEGDTVMDVIATAGSYTPDAMLEKATLTRKDSTEPIAIDLKAMFHKGDMSQNLKLEKGDVIYIPEDTINRFYVLGEVARPGLFSLRDNMTVLSAISLAGGPTPKAKMKTVMLVRGDSKNPERVPVNIAEVIAKGDISKDLELKPGDVVYVPESNKPDWNKISSFIQTLISVGYLRRYGLF